MPIIANSSLPSFNRLQQEGVAIISEESYGHSKSTRDIHIGLMNMMPDAALEPTERQFLRLIGSYEGNIRFFVYPFSPREIPRGKKAIEHIRQYYIDFEQIKSDGLDALIVSGANPISPILSNESFWPPLCAVLDWANKNIASTLCACLATHAALLYFHGIERKRLAKKRWGVFSHQVRQTHPLLNGIQTSFDVPHSRWNEITPEQMESAGLRVLVSGQIAGVHLATSSDGFRFIFFQGHPEYDSNSLLKEYKREVSLYNKGARDSYPPFPENYFSEDDKEILNSYANLLMSKQTANDTPVLRDFPETHLRVKNTWIDPGKTIFNRWLHGVSQIVPSNRKTLFRQGVNLSNLMDYIS